MTLPSFLVIGAGKCGTTSLYHHLARHPGIFMSPVKEPQYFAFGDRHNDLRGPGDDFLMRTVPPDRAAYEALFSEAGDASAIGEASTATIYEERACARVRETLPGARLIAILRDPAERAFSDFLDKRRHGLEPTATLEEALALEESRRAGGWSYRFHYRARGFYRRQLAPFFKAFDRAAIRVVLLDDLAARPAEVMADLYRFVGVEPADGGGDWMPRNAGPYVARPLVRCLLERLGRPFASAHRRGLAGRLVRDLLFHRPTLPPALRRRLVADYRDDILALQDLIGRDLGRWLSPEAPGA